MELWQRIKAARKFAGITQDQLSAHLGISRNAISYWESKNPEKRTEPTRKNLKKAADFMNVSLLWLEFGQGSKEIISQFHKVLDSQGADLQGKANNLESQYLNSLQKLGINNTEPAYDMHGKVPIISWVSAGHSEIPDMESDDGETITCPFSHSDMTYALRVVGDSMTSPPGARYSYPDGTIIFVDQEQRGGVGHGDRVIAKIEGHDSVTFKQLIIEGDQKYLKPLNPDYKPIFDPFRVLGKVLGGIVP